MLTTKNAAKLQKLLQHMKMYNYDATELEEVMREEICSVCNGWGILAADPRSGLDKRPCPEGCDTRG